MPQTLEMIRGQGVTRCERGAQASASGSLVHVHVQYSTLSLSSSFVDCKECGRKMHQICVLHYDIIWPSG